MRFSSLQHNCGALFQLVKIKFRMLRLIFLIGAVRFCQFIQLKNMIGIVNQINRRLLRVILYHRAVHLPQQCFVVLVISSDYAQLISLLQNALQCEKEHISHGYPDDARHHIAHVLNRLSSGGIFLGNDIVIHDTTDFPIIHIQRSHRCKERFPIYLNYSAFGRVAAHVSKLGDRFVNRSGRIMDQITDVLRLIGEKDISCCIANKIVSV